MKTVRETYGIIQLKNVLNKNLLWSVQMFEACVCAENKSASRTMTQNVIIVYVYYNSTHTPGQGNISTY